MDRVGGDKVQRGTQSHQRAISKKGKKDDEEEGGDDGEECGRWRKEKKQNLHSVSDWFYVLRLPSRKPNCSAPWPS